MKPELVKLYFEGNSFKGTKDAILKRMPGLNYRFIRPVKGYADFENIKNNSILSIFSFVDALHRGTRDVISSYRYVSSLVWVKYLQPTYFLTKEMYELVLRTDIPKNVNLNEIDWPLNSFLVMLPDGVIKTNDGNFSHLLISKIPKDINSIEQQLHIKFNETKEELWSWTTISDQTVTVGMQTHMDISMEDIEQEKYFRDGERSIKISFEGEEEADDKLNKFLSALSLKIILLMSSMPELLGKDVREKVTNENKETSGASKRIRSKRKRDVTKQIVNTPKMYFQPNFFGANPEISEATGTGQPQRATWVRGHFRLQPIGSRSESKKKVIWIKPFKRGKEQ